MIELDYSLVVEATEEPDYFGFYFPDLQGLTGVGHSIEDCIYKAKRGMKEHLKLLKEQGLPIPPKNSNPNIVIQNAQNRQLSRLMAIIDQRDPDEKLVLKKRLKKQKVTTWQKRFGKALDQLGKKNIGFSEKEVAEDVKKAIAEVRVSAT